MTIENMIKCCDNLTPTESQLAQYILQNKKGIEKLSIQKLSEETFISKSGIHRFCKKIEINGFNELKVKLAQDIVEESKIDTEIDVNFPFDSNDTQKIIAQKLLKLYEASIADTYNSIDLEVLNKSVKLLQNADIIDIYTHAHNINVAENFQDKMRSIGKLVNCPKSFYEQRCTATASKKNHAAIILSYSGKAAFLPSIVKILHKKEIEIIWIGRLGKSVESNHIKHNLYISNRENLRNRISQFSSHIAMQYMLDVIFSCIFKIDYERNIHYIKEVENIVDDRNINE
ncbi:RpiR family transcriptional regulator [Clostridium carboxidivorans P7]|uniref:Transcriptional regulator, RpiR family n=1 Tax=Clostridium carboxidivorans P7 TaxID=536227 RepID=C6PXD2_9CLOT|nr:MurR/RpiR family transcriptional regulator [Clostridium carboxidivorans]AKN31547.1 RpiR family transcriptional regulator [Clostridium carboxidivorans P7]EET86121.1 transcriptional regulator, RpiR family [Clostridium carboxidivorans P7]EFG87043.1 transcriptional regulator, RpiR family [Clostridium carboxidivorans P7]